MRQRGTTKTKNFDGVQFRRVPWLIIYWHDSRLVFDNFALQTRFHAEPLTCSILHFCSVWRSFDEVCIFLGDFSESSIRKSLGELCREGVLQRSGKRASKIESAMESWASWNPAAGFFHFSTKDLKFTPDPMDTIRELQARAKHHPMPLPVKNYPKARKINLPLVDTHGELPEILKTRRTWRLYGKKPVPLAKLAEILKLTFGIQGWVDVPGLGRAAMKTSPSCGCLHPIEAYVLAQQVAGLKRGLYHYNAQRHELEWLRAGPGDKAIERNLGNQWWFSGGSFLILMTAIFARTRWKYDFPRVYRGILIEAGHLCQTFCLTATWLGLAPFSTIAYTDTQWEKWLGIDGVNESVLYIAGAGTRPTDMKDAHMGTLAKAALE